MKGDSMTERPILFNDAMVSAILSGKKSMTRRPVKPQPTSSGDVWDEVYYKQGKPFEPLFHMKDGCILHCGAKSPFGQPGGRLWVRESTRQFDWSGDLVAQYCTDDKFVWDVDNPCDWFGKNTYKPPMHMPRGWSRIDLLVKRVWVERVQDISRDNVRAEGVPETWGDWDSHPKNLEPHEWDNMRYDEQFAFCWNAIYKKKGFGWAANPWVWCCEFERIEVIA